MTSSLFPKSPRLKEFRRARSWKCLSASRASAPTAPTDTLIEASKLICMNLFSGNFTRRFSDLQTDAADRPQITSKHSKKCSSFISFFAGLGSDASIDRRWKHEPSLWVNRHLNTSRSFLTSTLQHTRSQWHSDLWRSSRICLKNQFPSACELRRS